jgi:hypothetical protein
MKKSQYADYLQMLKRREQHSITTDTNPEAAKELKEMEKSSEKDEKDLTSDPSND